ncbi:MAG: hypothetical protein DMF76_25080, partial [Acidobacteria bacterium]
MKPKLVIIPIACVLLFGSSVSIGSARGDDFNAVVRAIEQFYHVKHQNIPLLARAGMKAAKTAARIRGGEYKRLAEAGSARVAFFEEQNFDS